MAHSKPPRMFPAFVRAVVDRATAYGANHHYRSFAPPRVTTADVIEHLVQPSDRPILLRAAEVNPHGVFSVTYKLPIEVDGWTSTYHVMTKTGGEFMWPARPTKAIPQRHESGLMEEVHQWVEHRSEVALAWMIVEALIDEFDRSGKQVSVLKELWPDFDMILHAFPGFTPADSRIKDWIAKWHDLPRPRSIDFPVPDTMDLLEDARKTVLAMTLMPLELPQREAGDLTSWLADGKMMQVPWYEWGMTRAVKDDHQLHWHHQLPEGS